MNLFDFFKFSFHAHNEIADNGADAKPCLSDVYKHTARGEKLQADAALCGRSMVEMLGVLAIIGVLSVGAISGYSKAMMKYKLNKQTEQLTAILNGAYQVFNLGEFRTQAASYGNIFLTDIMAKLNLIPQEMKKQDRYIFDSMGNRISVAYETSNTEGFFKIGVYVNEKESCQNVWNFSKELHNILWQTHYITTDNEDADTYLGRTYGDAYCSKGTNCLRDLSVAKIHDLCENCFVGNYCLIRIVWK